MSTSVKLSVAEAIYSPGSVCTAISLAIMLIFLVFIGGSIRSYRVTCAFPVGHEVVRYPASSRLREDGIPALKLKRLMKEFVNHPSSLWAIISSEGQRCTRQPFPLAIAHS